MSIKSSKLTPQNTNEATSFLNEIGCSSEGIKVMADKMLPLNIRLDNLLCGSINIMKQEALSIGIDVAAHKMCVCGNTERSNAILIGNRRKIVQLVERLEKQKNYFEFEQIIEEIKKYL